MNAPHDHPPPEAVTAQAARLQGLYIAALSAVACLSILGQCLVQWSLQRQLSDSTVVNIAGRQRMLSQQLTKAALALAQPMSDRDREARRSEIESVLEQWSRADRALRGGDLQLGLPGKNTVAIEEQLQKLQPHFTAMVTAAESLLRRPDDTAAVRELLTREPAFLAAMDSIVQTYEREARARVDLLRNVEFGLLGLTLLVLVCEGLFVFRPAVRRIRAAAAALLESRQALDLAKRKAESANEAKSQFLALVSHELRNPLQAVLGSAELAGESTDDERRIHLETISAAGRSLLGMLNDLLDMARIEAGKLDIVTAPFSPRQVVAQTAAMIEPQARARGLVVETTVADAVPSFVAGDELRVRQVLLNLLVNALKFTSRGSIFVRVSPTVGDKLRWEVRDTGRGIPAEQLAAIFAPFAQLQESDRPSGAGLGLAICRRLVELMSGEIGVESRDGEGSLFWFELPLKEASPPATHAAAKAVPSAARRRALVVDDDPLNRRLVAELIQRLQHDAVPAENGAEALARLEAERFDFVIVDWQMPTMNGGTLAAKIVAAEQAAGREPPILVALSAGKLRSDECGELFRHWLTKPVGLAELATVFGERATDAGDLWAAALARLNGRRDLLAKLAKDFRTGLTSLLTELQQAAAADNCAEVERLAHLLAGQAGVFAANDLFAAARHLEEEAAAGRLPPETVAAVVAEAEKLAAALAGLRAPTVA